MSREAELTQALRLLAIQDVARFPVLSPPIFACALCGSRWGRGALDEAPLRILPVSMVEVHEPGCLLGKEEE